MKIFLYAFTLTDSASRITHQAHRVTFDGLQASFDPGVMNACIYFPCIRLKQIL